MNAIFKFPLFLLACLTVQQNHCNAGLMLSTFGNVEYTADAAIAPLTFTIHDTDASSPEALVGWQLSLQIVADAGSTGTVSFTTASEPTDYLLAGINEGVRFSLSTTDFANDGILVNDLESLLFGVAVPGLPVNLIDIELTASADASGTFRLVAIPGANATAFADIAFNEVGFENVPFGGGPVTLGTFSASAAVPEPSCFVMACMALLTCAPLRRNRS